jgi:hypothetical protein
VFSLNKDVLKLKRIILNLATLAYVALSLHSQPMFAHENPNPPHKHGADWPVEDEPTATKKLREEVKEEQNLPPSDVDAESGESMVVENHIIPMQQQVMWQGQPMMPVPQPAGILNFSNQGNPYQPLIPYGFQNAQNNQHFPFMTYNQTNQPSPFTQYGYPYGGAFNAGYNEIDPNSIPQSDAAYPQLKGYQEYIRVTCNFLLFIRGCDNFCPTELRVNFPKDLVSYMRHVFICVYSDLIQEAFSLNLRFSNINNHQLRLFPINLTSLDLCENDIITDTGITRLTNLISLNLTVNEKITDAGITRLTNLISLKLSINEKITDEGITSLMNLTNLELDENYMITNTGITGLTNLTSLDLCDNDTITDAGIMGLTKLISLSLDVNLQITNNVITSLINLTRLGLRSNRTITDTGITGLTKLTSLDLIGTEKITDEGITRLTQLTKLDLRSNKTITDKGITRLTNLTLLDLGGHEMITDAGIMGLTKLTKLDLRGNSTITDAGITGLTKLTKLNLESNKTITDAGIMVLTKLAKLDLRGNSTITEEVLQLLPFVKVTR